MLKLYLARHLAAEDLRSLVGARLYEFDRLEKALQADKDQAASPQAVWVMDDAPGMCAAEVQWLKQVEAHIVTEGNVRPSEVWIPSSA